MRPLNYASVCSGVECMSVACRGLPLNPVFFSEIEPYPCAVLKYHYPNVPNLGDMTKIKVDREKGIITNGRTTFAIPDGGIDILAGGTPCQDFSVAGLRRGAGGDEGEYGSGSRSSLCFHYVRLLREIQPRWFIYENVPGMLTSNEGRDFAHFLLALGQVGYHDISWRVLDAQYVRVDGFPRAVPQRRRRVWVVGCLGEAAQRSAEVLLEPYGVRGNNPPRRKTGEELARSLGQGVGLHDRVVESGAGGGISNTLLATDGIHTGTTQDAKVISECLNVSASGVSVDANFGFPVADGVAHTQKFRTSPGHKNGVVETFRVTAKDSNSMKSANPDSGFPRIDVAPTIDTTTQSPTKAQGAAVIVEEKISGVDFYNQSLTGGVNITLNSAATDKNHTGGVVTERIDTNSNGGDVAATISACEHKQGQQQKDVGGGYVISRLREL